MTSLLDKSLGIGLAGTLCATFAYLLVSSIHHCLLHCRRRHKEEDPECPEELRVVPVTLYGSSSKSVDGGVREGDTRCWICLTDYQEGEQVRVLPRCTHMFHSTCINRWLDMQSLVCPVCRRSVIERPTVEVVSAKTGCRS